MAQTKLNNALKINGVIDTSKEVGQNLKALAEALGVYIVYDVTAGKWNVIIDGIAASVFSITDKHMIGSISLTSAPFSQIYTAVDVTFPNKDMGDKRDNLQYSIHDNTTQLVGVNTTKNYQPNEYVINQLSISTDLVNDPVLASMMALRLMRKTRFDKVIKFTSDFTLLGLKPGDVIDVTSENFGYDKKKFRILNIEEVDNDNTSITLNFTCSEYDDSIYDYSDMNTYSVFSIGEGHTITYYNTQLTVTAVDGAFPGVTKITGTPTLNATPVNPTNLTGLKIGDTTIGSDGNKYTVTNVSSSTLPNGNVEIGITGTPYVPGVLDPTKINAVSIPRSSISNNADLIPIETNPSIIANNSSSNKYEASPDMFRFSTTSIPCRNMYDPAYGGNDGGLNAGQRTRATNATTPIATGISFDVTISGFYKIDYLYFWDMTPSISPSLFGGCEKQCGIVLRNLNTGNIIKFLLVGGEFESLPLGGPNTPVFGSTQYAVNAFFEKGMKVSFETVAFTDYFANNAMHNSIMGIPSTSELYSANPSVHLTYIIDKKRYASNVESNVIIQGNIKILVKTEVPDQSLL